MMPDQTEALSHKRPRRRLLWRLLCIAVLTLLAFGWWWSQRSTMWMVARITLPVHALLSRTQVDDVVLLGADSGVLMGFDTSTTPATLSSTFTLYDWNGKPRWQVVAPVNNPLSTNIGGFNPSFSHGIIALSPDGHVFALIHTVNNRQRLLSWRDGHLLGMANLPPLSLHYFYQLQVTNNGRVWLYCEYLSPCRLWSVDGTKVSVGTYHPDFPANAFTLQSSLSPGGNRLICYQSIANVLEYATVQVKNEQVIIQRRYRTKAQWYRGIGFRWINAACAVDGEGMSMVDANGEHRVPLNKCLICSGGYRDTNILRYEPMPSPLRVYLPPPEQPWLIPQKGTLDGFACQAAGHTVLLSEYDTRLDLMDAFLSHLPILDRMADTPQELLPPPQWLAIYTAPGTLRAIQHLPRKGLALAYQLSPDGHHLALIFKYNETRHKHGFPGARELQFLKW